jgi:hypothetical protein
MFSHPEPAPTGATWSRGKLIAVLAFALVVALWLVAGLALAVYMSLNPPGRAAGPGSAHRPYLSARTAPPGPGAGEPVDAQARADALAMAPMRKVDPFAFRPGPLSTRDPGVIALPGHTRIGPAGVPTGFPHTPQGALAQLGALDKAAFESGSMEGMRAVIAGWAAPGGPTPQTWSGVKNMAEFFNGAGLSGGGSPELAVVVTPVMGLVKGNVGPDFVVVCVDFEMEATLAQTARIGFADCQRMVWQGRRWVIGPGAEAAPGQSVWPDTDAAIDAGYRDLRHG